MLKNTKTKNLGVALVEVLIGVSLVTVIAAFVGVTVTQFVSTRNIILADTKKMYLAEEGYEIIRFLRDENWVNIDSLSPEMHYYLNTSTTTLAIGGSPEIIDNFYHRSFLLQPVYRNGSGNIVASTTAGASLDPDTKKVFVYVSDANSTTTINALLTNLP